MPRKLSMKHVLILIHALVASSAFANTYANGANLADRKGCRGCHSTYSINRAPSELGPAFQDVAIKYANDKDAYKRLAEKIQKGGRGVWGPIPKFPGNVTQAEAEQLAKWVLLVK
jgi:cytochrome c